MKRREIIKLISVSSLVFALPRPLSLFAKHNIIMNQKEFEVIIIGGSYAGLSAAMALGRSLRQVLIIDAGSPCNKQTPHSHNFITQDGQKPSEIARQAKQQVLQYNTVQFLKDEAVSGKKILKKFSITTLSGKEFVAKKIIFATGIKDIMPNIKGFSDCWGISIIHCPYCHGYEFKNLKTGIYANVPRASHLALLVKNLTDDLTLIVPNKNDFDDDGIKKIEKNNIQIIDKQVTEIEHQNGNLQNIVFSDGKKQSLDALYADLPFKQHSEIPKQLGCKFTEQGHIDITLFQKTSIAGIYACGDNSTRLRSVANAVHTGNFTGAMVNAELAQEQF